MKITRFIRLSVLVGAPLLFAASAAAEKFPLPKVDYSADMVMNMGPGPDGKPLVMRGKIFTSEGAERREMNQAGKTVIMITHRDQRPAWMLMPEDKMYMEFATGQREKDPEDMMRTGDLKMTPLGSEEVNGVKATKYEIQVRQKEGGDFKGLLWVTKENIPVRMEGDPKGTEERRHFRIDYEKIKVGKQDPALFKIPAGYKKMEMPAMPGMGSREGGRPPKGAPPGGMTEEEMKKQAEEMMKQFQQDQGEED